MIISTENINMLSWDKMENLIPAIAQDEITGQVLMMAWMNKESLLKTIKEKKATFYSRKRKELWIKGEISGNFLYVSEIYADCDCDTLLLQVQAKGPACHLGTISCWPQNQYAGFLQKLDKVTESRIKDKPTKSYTTYLAKAGNLRMAQKVGEEAVETILAAVSENKQNFIEEASDLLFHLIVLLNANKLSLTDVVKCLHKRNKN